MTQRPSDDNIRQPRDWNVRQWWWRRTETKGKCEPPIYHCHKTSTCKGKYFVRITKKEDKKVTNQYSIKKSKGGGYESE